jgi:hypothetical protein
MSVGDIGPASRGDSPSRTGETLTQLLARILDQLSISSWLPSIFVVTAAVVYGNLAVNGGKVDTTVDSVAHMGGGPIGLLVGAVVLTNVLTQAFEFEAIRMLEGYWGSSRITRALAALPLRRQIGRVERLEGRRGRLRVKAYAEIGVCERDTPEVRAAKQRILVGEPPDVEHPAAAQIAELAGWQSAVGASTVRGIEAVERELESFPSAVHDVLPTRLGNTLRAYEERAAAGSAGPLEGSVQRVFHQLPMPMQLEHDQFRHRLDLYCNMTLLCLLSGAAGAGVLSTVGWKHVVVAAGASAVLAWLFYRSAVASAAGYGQVLISISEYVQMSTASAP